MDVEEVVAVAVVLIHSRAELQVQPEDLDQIYKATPAVKVIRAIRMRFANQQEPVAEVLGKQERQLHLALLAMVVTDFSCLLLQLCPHGLLVEVPER